MQLFISRLFSDNPADRFYFFAVVVTVVISIVLHELAHGWAAMRLGDPTPRTQGRMTGNPLVHMGPFSLVALALVGIAWGQMPIDPSRMRGRYAGAWVAAAGPAMNLLLAVAALTGLAVLVRFGPTGADASGGIAGVLDNATQLLSIAGTLNLVLMGFNLMPAPPLDGSRILADFSRGYEQFAFNPAQPGVGLLLFFGAFLLVQPMFEFATRVAAWYVGLLL
ncbi:MAG: site-2 protease family protein [Planctomycetota bacterium]